MSSPVVETVRTIPLIIEHQNHIPVEDEDISGFPFDRDSDRDGHFRSQLDDIAKRHPEFAEHLGNFSLRSGPRRRSSGGGTEDPDLHRRFERPFGGRFERFGFPFDRDDFDPEQYAQQFYQPEPSHQSQQQTYQQQPSYQHQTSYQPQPTYQQQQTYQQPQPEYQENHEQSSQPENAGNPPPAPERDRNNIQQSNTIDLGQKQEPVNERNQRSMSAPPTDKGQGQRFTSSINIPVNQPTSESENMAAQPQQQADNRTTERIIPIHIEGRDEPVLPKNAPSSYSQPHQTYNSSPQPERIFGQRPDQFTQFVNREPRAQYDKWHPTSFEPKHHGFGPEELLRQQRFPQQSMPTHFPSQQRRAPSPQQQRMASPQRVPPQHTKEEIPIPVQREAPQSKQQAPQQQATPPQQPPQPPKPTPQQQKPLTPIDQIQAIQKDVSALMEQVQQFAGQPKDKQYLYLDEMLTRNLLKLDNIDTQGQETIRSARKEAIKCIEKAIGVLEAKAAANVEPPKTGESMEVEKPQETPVEVKEVEKKDDENQPMETEAVESNKTEEKVEETQQQPMEIASESNASDAAKASAEVAKEVETKPETATVENKAGPQTENKAEVVETKEETSEAQESNLPVAEAVKKFEGGVENKEKEEKVEGSDEKKDDSKPEESESKVDGKKEEKKEKKKGKKKVEKKEK